MDDDESVLSSALDQLAREIEGVPRQALNDPTPCTDWTVADLVDHIVVAPEKFARMVRDEPVDWSAPTPTAGDDPAGAFRRNGAALLDAVREAGPSAPVSIDWVCAEFAVHTWDLTSARNRSTRDLNPEIARRGLAFMRANLTDDKRGPAFGPAQPVPEYADDYQRIAGFAGRSVI